jgi:hypothetical protein
MDDFAITAAMMQYGGSFVAGLGRLWRQADSENKAILKAAFSGYWRTYEAIATDRAEHAKAEGR